MLEASRWELNSEGDGVRSDYSNLARPLGGCPNNDGSTRYKAVSILSTASQVAGSN